MESELLLLLKQINPIGWVNTILLLYLIVYQRIRTIPDTLEMKKEIASIKKEYVTKESCKLIQKTEGADND